VQRDDVDSDRAGQLHHVELCTADLERALGFWEWFLGELGYDEKNAWDGGRSWANGPTYVVLKRADADTPSVDRESPGLNHLAFHGRSRDHVDALTAGVRDRTDATVLHDDQHPYAGGYYALYCEGPDGTKLEVVAPRPENESS
jgi:catechol 2,3-dioxygenase-like lactoylglutathione lyase family enzyme